MQHQPRKHQTIQIHHMSLIATGTYDNEWWHTLDNSFESGFGFFPRLDTAVTSWPRLTNRSHTAEPTYPVPPNTVTLSGRVVRDRTVEGATTIVTARRERSFMVDRWDDLCFMLPISILSLSSSLSSTIVDAIVGHRHRHRHRTLRHFGTESQITPNIIIFTRRANSIPHEELYRFARTCSDVAT